MKPLFTSLTSLLFLGTLFVATSHAQSHASIGDDNAPVVSVRAQFSVDEDILDELAREMDEAKIVKVNVDDNAELVKTYQVGSIPTLLVFDNGQVVSRYVGVANKDGLKALLTD